MIQGWAIQERAKGHREALVSEARGRRLRVEQKNSSPRETAMNGGSGVTSQRSATDLPVRGRAVRRQGFVGQKVGTWLIQAGTRLGGASIRTS